MRFFPSLFGASVDSGLSYREARRRVFAFLCKEGWQPIPRLEKFGFARYGDFFVSRGTARLFVKVSGKDRRLRHPLVSDIRNLAIKYNFIPVYILGEWIDKLTLAEMIRLGQTYVQIDDLHQIETVIERARPRVTGSLLIIKPAGAVIGWAKLSPTQERATIRVRYYNVEVGEGVADEFRPALLSVGDGKYGFTITTLPFDPDRNLIESRLQVRVLRGNEFLKVLEVTPATKVIA